MIGATSGVEKSVKCTAAITVAYTIGKFGADDNTVSLATATTDKLLGIFQHVTTAANEEVRVMLSGISNLVIGDAVTRGDLITADSAGKGVLAVGHTHTENTAGTYAQNAKTAAADAVRVIGVAMASGIAGDIIPVLIKQA